MCANSDESTTSGGHEHGQSSVSQQRFSPHYNSDSSVELLSGDEHSSSRKFADVGHRHETPPPPSAPRSESPFPYQGQSFQTTPSVPPSFSPLSRASVDSRSSGSHHHQRSHHRHGGHSRANSPPLPSYSQRPRTPGPVLPPNLEHFAPRENLYAESKPLERPSAPQRAAVLLDGGGVSTLHPTESQHAPPASQSSRQSSYIVSICTDIARSCTFPLSSHTVISLASIVFISLQRFSSCVRVLLYVFVRFTNHTKLTTIGLK